MCGLRTCRWTDVDPPRVELPSAGAYLLATPGAITYSISGPMYGRLIDRQQLRRAVGLLRSAQWAPRTCMCRRSAANVGSVTPRDEVRGSTQTGAGRAKKWGHKLMAIFCQILTDLKKFTGRFPGKFVVKLLFKIPPHLAYAATLPCVTSLSARQAINDKLQGSVATYLRCGGLLITKLRKIYC